VSVILPLQQFNPPNIPEQTPNPPIKQLIGYILTKIVIQKITLP
jgi:hypothetical protein